MDFSRCNASAKTYKIASNLVPSVYALTPHEERVANKNPPDNYKFSVLSIASVGNFLILAYLQ